MTKLIATLDEAKIDAIFAGVDQCHLPGAAVAVAIDGVPVYRKGFGLAHMELPVVLSPTMRMRIGSTTKHFTALIYLLLCEEGRADIDAETMMREMIAREKKKGRVLPAHMEGGPANPLGARALYLGSTLYRIHGTNAPWTIGQNVSSGCIRLRNEDVMDLYDRVKVGTKVVVL